jgi:tetratricopeptide (TPR) repeat protein
MRRSLFLAVALLVLVVGCATGKNRQDRAGESNVLHANPSQFDLAKDPPISAETRFAAGQFAESQGRLDVAIEQYREAVKVNPKQESSLYRLGILYTQAKNYSEAIDIWKQYVTATGRTAAAYSNLGYGFELAGKLQEAELAYKYGIKVDPTNRVCRINYGRMLVRIGRELEAEQQFSAVLKPSDVHFSVGAVYEQMSRTAEARAEYEKAVKADPTNNQAQARLTMLAAD